ncbi:MAG: hypothetical protein HN833_04235 [Elusimicrobiaceae bacterium]|nr:hypothetical protein [Elusimicrobiaceae bacterium]MBT3955415.1 hypothetical protein [Elusimicrobiaceae bacterium]MBT4007692.1 hypothetical protein [Elusimicrobiaceae bacterium]MBT4439531.1 hypothetical protein [Elusimicrobiaceae bacterium]MBT6715366.1 hypothetical protein [Elusimicrobiaceae bacterium]
MKKFLTLLFFIMFTIPLFSEFRTPVMDSLLTYDEYIDTLEIEFTQKNYFDDTKLSENKGKLYMDKQRNLIRLDSYNLFDEIDQYVITNGKVIKVYDKENKLITKTKWKDWYEAQTNKFLFDFGSYEKVIEDFNLVEHSDYELKFVNKVYKDQKVEFELTKKYFPKEIKVINEDITNIIILTDTKLNETIEKEVFKQYDTIK